MDINTLIGTTHTFTSLQKSLSLSATKAAAFLVEAATARQVATCTSEDGTISYTFTAPAATTTAKQRTVKPRGQSEKNANREKLAMKIFNEVLAATGEVTQKSFFAVGESEGLPYRDFLWVARKAVAAGSVTEVKAGRGLAWKAAAPV